ncbi:MAG: disulfide bond formation protein B [Halioglobus sp.]|nr:disulfide bond formation protein B [Halioglobus sp.]
MLQQLSPRMVFIGLALLGVSAYLIARLYMEAYLQLDPCPLCMTQRVPVVVWSVIAIIAAAHNPGRLGRSVYAGLCGLCAYLGGLVSARHIWLQNLPEDLVPACGPSLDYMLSNLPFMDTVRLTLAGDGNCAETMWTFLGLSIPEQCLLLFALVMAVSLWQGVRR